MAHTAQKVFLRILDKSLVVVAMVGFIGMLLATGGQVLFRYVLKIPVPWTEELARILFILSMFLGIAIAIREREHIVVNFLFKKMSTRAQAIGHIVFDGAILILLCFLARGTVSMVQIMWNSYMIALDWIRTAYLYIGEFIAILFMMFYIILEILENARAMRSRKEVKAVGEKP
ncbi:MAG: TRAP transporter small permease subunit [Proteobacteria bacterium]|nr:TRAP transporter small permease subunit [Pseudomonadota bacterium]